MKTKISIITLIILFGCDSGPKYQKVMVNKAIKVFSEGYHDKAENYTFKWAPPLDPNNKKIIFDLKKDMLIFTPKMVGNYKVNLSIEDISEQVVSKEIFYFKAIQETIEVAIIEPIKEALPTSSLIEKKPAKQLVKQSQSKTGSANKQKIQIPSNRKKQQIKKQIAHAEYAIQISAWPSLEEARKQQLELIDIGFDAYTQQFYFQKNDEVWYRVRVGNFMKKDKALVVKKHIESSTGITTWLDFVLSK